MRSSQWRGWPNARTRTARPRTAVLRAAPLRMAAAAAVARRERRTPSRSALRWLELRVLRQQLLHADGVEPDGYLEVVVVFLDRDDGPDAELLVPDPYANPQAKNRLILALIVVRGLGFLHPSPTFAGVRVRPKLVVAVAERTLIRSVPGRSDALDQFCGNLVEEARWLSRLVLAEYPAPRRARQHQVRLRSRHADVAQAPFFLELFLILARARVWKQPL